MNNTLQNSAFAEWLRPRLFLSFISAFSGWIALLVSCLVTFLVRFTTESTYLSNGVNPLVGLFLIGIGSAFVVLAVWLTVLLPLVLVIPDDSFLWNPKTLTTIGILAGPLIVSLIALCKIASDQTMTYGYFLSGIVFPGLPSALIGGVTCAVAAQLHVRLLKKKMNANSSSTQDAIPSTRK